jgi:hypothetical protein
MAQAGAGRMARLSPDDDLKKLARLIPAFGMPRRWGGRANQHPTFGFVEASVTGIIA